MKKNPWFLLVFCLIIPQLAGGLGTLFTTPSIGTWYAALNKPSFNPPNWIFGPVWTSLFLLMGFALYLVWKNTDANLKDRNTAVILFFIQLVLNVLWSYFFFGLRNPFFGLIEIAIFWAAIFLTIIKFYKVSKPASYLMLPYLAWVSFASVLNFYIWRLN